MICTICGSRPDSGCRRADCPFPEEILESRRWHFDFNGLKMVATPREKEMRDFIGQTSAKLITLCIQAEEQMVMQAMPEETLMELLKLCQTELMRRRGEHAR